MTNKNSRDKGINTIEEDLLEYITKELSKPAEKSSFATRQIIREMYNGTSLRFAKESHVTPDCDWLNDKWFDHRIYLKRDDILGEIVLPLNRKGKK